MIITLPKTPLEKIYAMYGCLDAYHKRMNRLYLIRN